KGLKELAKLDKIDGAAAFFLYESYGFPFELTAEIAAEKGQELKQEDFDAAAQAHKEKSKSASADKFRGGLADVEAQTIKYHTATHLLLSALRSLVSDQITQKGSNITGERARFDFNFDRPLTPEEIKKVEDQINQWIAQSTEVECKNMAKDQALKEATVAVFADRYPDEVTLYQVGDVSKEICMGPHVKNTAEIGKIAITKEKSASAGVRRVYLEIV
ncbi:MAG: hypothetical protein LBG64_00405, partial [Pseudomonadales bacterium]|nr:hypothetical protein [Pseudomonadales bacterium]